MPGLDEKWYAQFVMLQAFLSATNKLPYVPIPQRGRSGCGCGTSAKLSTRAGSPWAGSTGSGTFIQIRGTADGSRAYLQDV